MDYFNRKDEKDKVLSFIDNFDHKNYNKSAGIYIIGPNGCGKTTFVKSLIDKDKYDSLCYDASDFRNKNYINDIIVNSV